MKKEAGEEGSLRLFGVAATDPLTALGEKKRLAPEMAKTYNPKAVEALWYEWWEKSGFSVADPEHNKKPPFVIVPWHVSCGGVCYGDGNLVFIANDWQTALVPVYLQAFYRDNGFMQCARSVLVIYNMAHQTLEDWDFPIITSTSSGSTTQVDWCSD